MSSVAYGLVVGGLGGASMVALALTWRAGERAASWAVGLGTALVMTAASLRFFRSYATGWLAALFVVAAWASWRER